MTDRVRAPGRDVRTITRSQSPASPAQPVSPLNSHAQQEVPEFRRMAHPPAVSPKSSPDSGIRGKVTSRVQGSSTIFNVSITQQLDTAARESIGEALVACALNAACERVPKMAMNAPILFTK